MLHASLVALRITLIVFMELFINWSLIWLLIFIPMSFGYQASTFMLSIMDIVRSHR
jgi:hypothetical protein